VETATAIEFPLSGAEVAVRRVGASRGSSSVVVPKSVLTVGLLFDIGVFACSQSEQRSLALVDLLLVGLPGLRFGKCSQKLLDVQDHARPDLNHDTLPVGIVVNQNAHCLDVS